MTGFIDHMYTTLGTTGSYRAIADLHTLQITTALSKLFPACCVTSRSLTTASNSGYSSASCSHVVTSLTLLQDCLPAIASGTLSPILCRNCQLPTISLLSLPSYSANCQLRRFFQLSANCRFSTHCQSEPGSESELLYD
jgi:hypothetical protein